MKNFRTRLVGCLGLLVLLVTGLSGQQIPQYTGYVNDFANVIPAQYQEQITQICTELQEKTGAQIAVVTIPTLEDNYIEDYAVRLFEAWGIGQKGKDNGVLILNAIQERKIRIEIGYGIEGIIPDANAGRIRDQYLIPYLKQGDFGNGYLHTVAAIANEIATEYGVTLTGSAVYRDRSDGPKSKGIGGFLGILILFFLILITRGRILPWLLLGSMLGGGRGRSGWGGFGNGGGFGGGFGGFGGGMSGGGGASGSY